MSRFMLPVRMLPPPVSCNVLRALPGGGAGWWVAAAVLVGLLGGCANPVAPTGGPGNTEPARLVQSQPANEAVNVSRTTTLAFQFDKYIRRGAMEQAFTMTPEPPRPPEFDYSGRRVSVVFETPLRDSTTYIVSLSSDLRTARGNVELDAPITLAFSTGARIDQGRLAGRVVEPQQGEPQSEVNVFAYALPTPDAAPPDTLPAAPDFRTQTDTEGRFAFQNIREETYYVVAVRDANRNRRPDPEEAYAVPPSPRLPATRDTAAVAQPWLLTEPRPAPPRAERVRPRTVREQTVRMSQPVSWRTRRPGQWTLVDSTAQDTIGVQAVFTATDTPYEVVVVAEQALRLDAIHRLTVPDAALVDSLGRAVPDTTLRFTPADAEHAPTTDFLGFRPDRADAPEGRPLTQGESPMLRTTRPLPSGVWNAQITAADTAGTARPLTPSSPDGLRYRLQLDPPLGPEGPIEVQVPAALFANVDTVRTQRYRRLARDELGAIEVPIAYERRALRPGAPAEASPDSVSTVATLGLAAPDTVRPARTSSSAARDTTTAPGGLVLEMYDTAPRGWPMQRIATDTTGTARFDRVPPGQYRFRLWRDRNGTGRWSPGQLAPYRPADPVVWSSSTVEGRARWTNVLSTPLVLVEPLRPEPTD